MTTGQRLDVGQSPSRAQRRRLLLRTLLRSVVSAAVLVALYYVLPLQDLRGHPVWVSLSVGLVVLVVAISVQVRAITTSPYPALRAVEALALTVPFFLLMFSAAYVLLAQDGAANFSTHELTRTDALYFVLTVFATVGFGDITATSQSARVLVMVQMVLDLVILGLGVQVFRGAVQVGRQHSRPVAPGQPEDEQPDDKGMPEQVEGSQA
jgi:voltage-gated potassium channel